MKTIAKLNFLKYRVLEPRTAQNPRPRKAKAKDNTVEAKDFTNLSSRPRTSSRTTSLLEPVVALRFCGPQARDNMRTPFCSAGKKTKFYCTVASGESKPERSGAPLR